MVRLKAGKIDRDEADAALAARREPARPLRRSGGASPTTTLPTSELPTLLLKTRIKSETEKGKLLETKNKALSGQYVLAEEVEDAAFARGRQVRDNLLSIPDRLDAQLAAESDRNKVHAPLTNELMRVLEDIIKPLMQNRNS